MYFPELINYFVERAVSKVAQRCSINIQQLREPEITDALVTELPGMLNKAIPSTLGVRFGGCFIHQKPKAHFSINGAYTSREIGDLLVVSRQKIGGNVIFNAVIFQMKMHDNRKDNHHINDKGELEQLYLYQHWPLFDCSRNGVKTTFDIYPKSPRQGAQYSLVCRKIPKHQLRIYHSLPAQQMSLYAGLSFGDFLHDFIINQKGSVITCRAEKDKEEWSRLIWYLIDLSWISVYNLSRIGRNNELRISGDFFDIHRLMTETAMVNSNVLSLYETMDTAVYLDVNVGEGISLLLIDVKDDYQLKYSRYKNYMPEYNL